MALVRFLSQHVYEQLKENLLQSDDLLQSYLELIQEEPILTLIQHAIDYEYSKQQLKSIARQIFHFPIGWQHIFATQLLNYSASLKSPQRQLPSSVNDTTVYQNVSSSLWSAWKSGRISPVEIYRYLNLAVEFGDISETGREE